MALAEKDKKNLSDFIETECIKAGTTAANLLCAPEACCIMNALTIIAQCTIDFSLKNEKENHVFVHLNEPESFKASLYQVINVMCDAFRKADKSMSVIQLSLNRMPVSLDDIVEAIDQLDNPESLDIIRESITSINGITKTCVEAATNANDGCSKALEVIQELLANTISTKGRNEQRAVAATAEYQKQRHLEEQKKEFLMELRMKYEEQKGIARQALEDYKMNLNSEITDVLTIMIVTNLCNILNSIAKTANSLGTVAENLSARSVVLLKEDLSNSPQALLNREDVMSKVMENVLLELIENIVKQENEEIIEQCETHINHLNLANQFKNSTELGKMLQEISKKLVEGLQSMKNNEAESQAKFNDAKIAAELYLKSFEKADEYFKSSESSKKEATQEQLTLIKMHEERLKLCREDVDRQRKFEIELRKEMMVAREEVANIMGEIQKLKMEEINLDQILKYLHLGIQQITRVQIAWKRIVTFFDHISTTIEYSLVPHLKYVTTSITSKTEKGLKNYGSMHRQKLLREISKANGISNILIKCVEFYATISEQYVTPLLENSIRNFGLKQKDAQERQNFISYNFGETTEKVQNAVTLFNQTLQAKVYEAMQQQQFHINNAIGN